jgi:hypothetical protein
MKKVLPLFVVAMGLMGWSVSAADFDLVAYTGHYVPTYDGSIYDGTATIENLTYIPKGPNGWQRIEQPCNTETGYCDAEQIEVFLFISTDFTDKGVAGMDFNDPTSNPISGIYSGNPGSPDPYVTINNRARWAGKSGWTPIDGEKDPWGGNGATFWDTYYGYSAANDTFMFYPFNQYALGPLSEEGVPPYSNPYTNDWMKAVALQWNAGQGYADQDLGKGGVLVPYIHMVINKEAMPCGTLTWFTISALPALINGLAPQDQNFTLNWLGKTFNGQAAPWVPSGKLEVYCIPEPASLAVLAVAGIPLLLRRRR